MNPNKDYYRALGVLEDAEDIVIKAAYRVLAQKYHPDKFQGNPKSAEERMQEINEAYSVLSDPISRKKYDEERVKSDYDDESTEDADDLLHTLDKDWAEALEFFPDLAKIASTLSKYSKQLEYAYKVLVIEGKKFNQRNELANHIKDDYLKKYFGTNKKILDFAEMLFLKNRREILAKLNRAVNLLGSNVDPNIIIEKLKVDLYPNTSSSGDASQKDENVDSLKFYAHKLFERENLPQNLQLYYSLELLRLLGVRVHQTGVLRSKFDVYDGKDQTLSEAELIDFAVAKAKKYTR